MVSVTDCKSNKWVLHGAGIALQIALIFTFLTVFYFTYVTGVEAEEFDTQIGVVVDNIYDSAESKIIDAIDKRKTTLDKYGMLSIIDGGLDATAQKVRDLSKKSDADVGKTNKKTIKKSYIFLLIAVGSILGIVALVAMLGFCVISKSILGRTVVAVFFVALTEFVFLQTIASRFIAADPYEVRRKVGKEIDTWIRANKK
jgi:predicted membrane channel-forming protein YqfA (hemolysin III family)